MNAREMITRAKEIRTELMMRFPIYQGELGRIVFSVNTRLRTTAGKAKHKLFMVQLSNEIFRRAENESNFRNTVLHEIAHLLVGPGNGHNRRWKAMHRRIGGNAERCHSMACKHNARDYRAVCMKCETVMPITKRKHTNMVKAYRRGGKYRHNCGGDVVPIP